MSPDHDDTQGRRGLRRIAWVVGAALVIVAAIFLRKPLESWFFPGSAPEVAGSPGASEHAGHAPGSAGPASSASHPAPHAPLPDAVLDQVTAALAAYDRVGGILARDETAGLGPLARELHTILQQAASAKGPAEQTKAQLAAAAGAAEKLAQAGDLPSARASFAALSEALIAVVAADPRLEEGWFVFECPMVEGFGGWIQSSERLENPYMGPSMLTCGNPAEWERAGKKTTLATSGERGVGARGAGDHADPETIAYYTCSMHPSVRQSGPGTCPICSMNLVPVTKKEAETGVVIVDEERRQRIGVTTAVIEEAPLTLSIRAVGKVTYDETRLVDVTLRVKGWIEKLYLDATGAPVRAGQPLFLLYSPELYAAEQELVLALRSQEEAAGTTAPERVSSLVDSALQRLRLWGLSDGQLAELKRTKKATERRLIFAPKSGFVIEKNVVEGAAVDAGQRLYRIAPLDTVWVEADVYEADVPYVSVGQKATITLPYVAGRTYEGKVAYVYPYLEGGTRTGRIRIQIRNPRGELKPDMYANVSFERPLGKRLAVPAAAVLYTGPRRIVFVDTGEGRLRPQPVELGVRADEFYEVLSGLKAGDVVVTSGNFLIAAESRIRSAATQWEGEAPTSHEH